MSKIQIAKEQQFAQSQKWTRLGKFPIEVREPISQEERVDLGMVEAQCVAKINGLQEQKKVFCQEIKSKIEEQKEILNQAAETTRIGSKAVEKILPCFYDPKTDQRVFIDLDTGEEVHRRKADPEDRQMKVI